MLGTNLPNRELAGLFTPKLAILYVMSNNIFGLFPDTFSK